MEYYEKCTEIEKNKENSEKALKIKETRKIEKMHTTQFPRIRTVTQLPKLREVTQLLQ